MPHFGSAGDGVDPQLTERFLKTLPEVYDASVWASHDGLAARVTMLESHEATHFQIRRLCLENLGLHQTPRSIEIVRQRSIAA